jgi:small subunit ribosomal protein S9
MEVINAIGRRKSAIARIYLNDGTGKITVNDTDAEKYFTTQQLMYIIHQPLNLLSVREKYDIKVNLEGGGISGQAEALRLAIARALIKISPERKHELKVNGFLTRDSREVERKKPGQKKARKRFQFSKR